MTNCYITLDYELCMGVTGSVRKCLIEPMNALLKAIDIYNVKLNIMVDTAYILKLKELKAKYPTLEEDYNKVTTHLIELYSKGHSIQLHCHPQWLHSTYDGEQWILDYKHYKLSDVTEEEQEFLIVEGVNTLKEIGISGINTFRAGGFSLHNFMQLKPFFNKSNIYRDTSVLRGGVYFSSFQTYDYRSVPNESSYKFEDSLSELNENGTFSEYPISLINMNSIRYLMMKRIAAEKAKNSNDKPWRDGIGIGYPGSKLHKLSILLCKLFHKQQLYATIDGSLSFWLSEIYEYTKKHVKGNDFVIIGHPKAVTPYSISQLVNFIRNYQKQIKFRTF